MTGFIDAVVISNGVNNGKRTNTTAVDEAVAAWSSATTYAALAQVNYLHGIYESRVAGNVNSVPTTATDKWRYLGPLNSWAMFDQTVETQTQAANMIEVVLNLQTGSQALALLNLDANDVQVIVNDPTLGVIYDRTQMLADVSAITDMWAWLFLPISRKRDVVFTDLPQSYSSTITIRIRNPGNIARCGVCAIGMFMQVGVADYSTSVGITDYSKIKENEFGDRVVTLRSYAKRANFPITLLAKEVDRVQQLLADYRQQPLVWIGSDVYESTIIFGPYKSFEIIITNFGISRCNLEVQGLI